MFFKKKSRALQSPHFAKKRRKKVIGLIVVSFISVIIFITIIIFGLRLSFLQISKIDITGNSLIQSKDISDLTFSELKGYYPLLIPKANILFFPKKKIKNSITDSFKSIETISINRIGLSSIRISIQERQSASLVCEGFFGDNILDSDCYFSDKEGYVFAKAHSISTSSDLYKYYISGDKGDEIIGTNFIDPLMYKELTNFLSESKHVGIEPLGILISDERYEMYSKRPVDQVHISTSTQSFITIYFDDRNSLQSTFSNLKTFWQTLFDYRFTTTTPENINFIDLRYGKTIFYSEQ